MRYKRFKVALVGLMALAAFDSSLAAEIRGRLWQSGSKGVPSGTTVGVRCGSWKTDSPVAVSKDGSYSVRGIPSGRGCELTVRYADGSTSKPVAFNSGRSVVNFNAEVRRYKGRVLVFRR